MVGLITTAAQGFKYWDPAWVVVVTQPPPEITTAAWGFKYRDSYGWLRFANPDRITIAAQGYEYWDM